MARRGDAVISQPAWAIIVDDVLRLFAGEVVKSRAFSEGEDKTWGWRGAR